MLTLMNRLCLLFGLLVVSVSCGSNNGTGGLAATTQYQVDTTKWASGSNVGFYMTDAAPSSPTYRSVNVTVTEVDLHTSQTAADNDAGWQKIVLSSPIKLDLMMLQNKANSFLADTNLTAGTYQQVRLILSPTSGDNTVVVTTNGVDTTYTLDVPSGSNTGLKFNTLNFTVDPSKKYAIVFDFKTDASIVATGSGKYILKPVISVNIGELNADGTVSTSPAGNAQ